MSLTITVISGLYQKIDPKVREARRKKFFGSGRRKRDAEDEEKEDHKIGDLEEDLLLEVFGAKDLEEEGHNADGSRRGRANGLPSNSESRFHAFHSCKKCHLCHPDCQCLALFPFFIPVGGQFFRDNAGLWGKEGLPMKPQLDLRTERSICRGHLSELGCTVTDGVQRGLTVWSAGSTNAFIILMVMNLSIIIIDALPQWLLFSDCTCQS